MNDLTQPVRPAAAIDDIRSAFGARPFDALAAGEVGAIARRLRRAGVAPQIRIAYLGNHTIEPLPDYVGARNLHAGIVDAAFIAPYNQHFQVLLDPGSDLAAFAPQLLILSLSLRELAPRIVADFAGFDEGALEAERARILGHVIDWIAAAKKATQAHILVGNFALPSRWQAGIADQKSAASEQTFYLRLNLELAERLRGESRAHILDVDRILAAHGKARAYSPKLYYLARMEWHESALPRLAEEIHRYVRALLGRTRKCLVLDLDNTLWGGVVGEDGADAIKVGKGNAVDEAYFAFQQYVRSLKHRGVILALASKNNPGDVVEAFQRRSDMPLKLDDFAAREINWEPKHENLARIATALNIGVDSLVFADDSPAECALIKEMLPEVEVVHLAGDPARFVDLLEQRAAFERLEITEEDRRKTQSYLENQTRAGLHQSAGSLESYLTGLETRIVARRPSQRDAGRIHQLFNKTNQFNVTTKRYTPAEVAGFMASDAHDLWVVDVADRFGDLGTVGLILIDRSASDARIDSFVMSCRAMGREVETAIMNELKREYLQSQRCPALVAQYTPTRKNQPVERFFDSQGFAVISERDDGERIYRLLADRASAIPCAHITVVTKP